MSTIVASVAPKLLD